MELSVCIPNERGILPVELRIGWAREGVNFPTSRAPYCVLERRRKDAEKLVELRCHYREAHDQVLRTMGTLCRPGYTLIPDDHHSPTTDQRYNGGSSAKHAWTGIHTVFAECNVMSHSGHRSVEDFGSLPG